MFTIYNDLGLDMVATPSVDWWFLRVQGYVGLTGPMTCFNEYNGSWSLAAGGRTYYSSSSPGLKHITLATGGSKTNAQLLFTLSRLGSSEWFPAAD